jgi:hypothetical protein
MIPENLPDYVERGGRQVWRPPYSAKRAELFGFVLDAERPAIDALLHHDLCEPSNGGVDYRCAHPSIVVVFAKIDSLTSTDEPDSARGYVSELEVSVWCLVADCAVAGRLLWYLPYVFVTPGQAVASGREVFGYPKQMGEFPDGFPDALWDGGETIVEAEAIDHFGPGAQATQRPMIGAERTAANTGDAGVTGQGSEAFKALSGHLEAKLEIDTEIPFGPAPPSSAVITPKTSPPPSPTSAATVPAWAARRVLDTLSGRELDSTPADLVADLVANPNLLFLKQFRDASCPTKACYQAILEAPLSVHPLSAKYKSLDPALFEITIQNWDSHPIATDVGVQAGTPLEPTVAFRAELDFDIQLGDEVWRAQT